jgi:hypothetical protein
LLLESGVSIKLALQSFRILAGLLGQGVDEFLNALAATLPKIFGAAEVSGVVFDQYRIQMILTD